MKTSGVYVIRHRDGRAYVGSSKDVQSRWRAHRRELLIGIHHTPKLQQLWNESTPSDFTFAVI